MTKYWDFLHTTEKVAMENKGKQKKKKKKGYLKCTFLNMSCCFKTCLISISLIEEYIKLERSHVV